MYHSFQLFFENASVLMSLFVVAVEKENDRFIDNQSRQAKQIIREQDENLTQLGNAVDRIGAIGREIKQELDVRCSFFVVYSQQSHCLPQDQNRMLGGLSEDMDKAQSRMDQVQSQLGKLLGTKDGCQIWTVVILALILIMLGKSLKIIKFLFE